MVIFLCWSMCDLGLMWSFLSFQVTECPSVYEMLPNPEFEWKEVPKICVWRKGSPDEDESSPAKFESYGPLESISLFEEALRDNEVCTENLRRQVEAN